MKPKRHLKSPEEVRADFERMGLSVAAWSRTHKLNARLVYEILRPGAHRRCLRGQSHRIAVLLGLKHGELVASPEAVNAPEYRQRQRGAR